MSDDLANDTEHMSPEEFRKVGKEMIDWIADYMEKVKDYPVLSKSAPGDVRAMLPATPPVKGSGFDEIFPDTGSHQISTHIFQPTLQGRASSATCLLRVWAFKECCGPPAQLVRSWKRMS